MINKLKLSRFLTQHVDIWTIVSKMTILTLDALQLNKVNLCDIGAQDWDLCFSILIGYALSKIDDKRVALNFDKYTRKALVGTWKSFRDMIDFKIIQNV